jgi:hypothetical protein
VDADSARRLFRHANLRLLHLLAEESLDEVPFLCECDDPLCFESVVLSTAEFEQVCSEGGFLIVRGHTVAGVGRRETF